YNYALSCCCVRKICQSFVVLCTVAMFVFFKQKTAYEITTGDWSSDVCSSDLTATVPPGSSRRSSTMRETMAARSEERRVGKECRLLCSAGRATFHEHKRSR